MSAGLSIYPKNAGYGKALVKALPSGVFFLFLLNESSPGHVDEQENKDVQTAQLVAGYMLYFNKCMNNCHLFLDNDADSVVKKEYH